MMANLLEHWEGGNQPESELVQEVASDEEMIQVARPPDGKKTEC
jgi:hypothetical protein